MRSLVLAVSIFFSLANADFIRNDKEHVVTDSATQMMWQDNDDTTSIRLSWEKSLSHCEAYEFGGYTDWRLPTKQELLTIVDGTKKDIKINAAFKNISSYVYWSSSKPKGGLPLAWRVDFDDAKAHWGARKFAFLVRCVRDAEVSE